jgi:hypothetical protein
MIRYEWLVVVASWKSKKIQWCNLSSCDIICLAYPSDVYRGIWLPQNSVVTSVHHSNGMFLQQKNIWGPGKSHHCQFSAEFPHKVSKSHGQLIWYAATTAMCNSKCLCISWIVEWGRCSWLLLDMYKYWSNMFLVFIVCPSDFQFITLPASLRCTSHFLTELYSLVLNLYALIETSAEHVMDFKSVSHRTQSTFCCTLAIQGDGTYATTDMNLNWTSNFML